MSRRPLVNIFAPWIAVAAVWLWLFSHLHIEWSLNPQYNYGWAIPFLALHRRFFPAFASSRGRRAMAEAFRLSRLFAACRSAVAGTIRKLYRPDDDARGCLRGGGNCRLVWSGRVSARQRHPVAERFRRRR